MRSSHASTFGHFTGVIIAGQIFNLTAGCTKTRNDSQEEDSV